MGGKFGFWQEGYRIHLAYGLLPRKKISTDAPGMSFLNSQNCVGLKMKNHHVVCDNFFTYNPLGKRSKRREHV